MPEGEGANPASDASAGWTAFGASDVGLVRARNEDAFAVDLELGCYLVADGLGGHRGGDVASALARDSVLESLRRDTPARGDVEDALERAVRAGNTAILEASRQQPSLAGMGTTLSMLWLEGADNAFAAHVGDSRIYGLHETAMTLLTEDHTVGMELVRAGMMTIERAERSAVWHQLTRAVGLDERVAVDVFAVAPANAFLLCSDGLTGMVDDDTIERLLRAHAPDPEAACAALVDAAIANGGDDNVSVVVLYGGAG